MRNGPGKEHKQKAEQKRCCVRKVTGNEQKLKIEAIEAKFETIRKVKAREGF